LFVICFFHVYNVIMHCMKYADKVNKPLVAILFTLIGLLTVWAVLGGIYTGTVYIYQNVIGGLYGLIFLVLCLNFDKEIHRLCEKTGFIVQTSRKYKFYLFFLCLGLFVAALIYYNSELDNWTMPQQWVVNASYVTHSFLIFLAPRQLQERAPREFKQPSRTLSNILLLCSGLLRHWDGVRDFLLAGPR